MAKRKHTKRTVRTWEVDSGRPGLTPPNAEDTGIDVLLANDIVSQSAALRDAADGRTWQPFVLIDVAGRYNRTSMTATLRIALPADAAISVGEGLLIAGRRALEDTSAGIVEDGLS